MAEGSLGVVVERLTERPEGLAALHALVSEAPDIRHAFSVEREVEIANVVYKPCGMEALKRPASRTPRVVLICRTTSKFCYLVRGQTEILREQFKRLAGRIMKIYCGARR